MIPQWEGFKTGLWQKEIDARDLIDAYAADPGNCRKLTHLAGAPRRPRASRARFRSVGLKAY